MITWHTHDEETFLQYIYIYTYNYSAWKYSLRDQLPKTIHSGHLERAVLIPSPIWSRVGRALPVSDSRRMWRKVKYDLAAGRCAIQLIFHDRHCLDGVLTTADASPIPNY